MRIYALVRADRIQGQVVRVVACHPDKHSVSSASQGLGPAWSFLR